MSFQYVRISHEFIQTLMDLILSNNSIVLLGSRYTGKRHVITYLQDHLAKLGVHGIIRIDLLDQTPLTSEDQVRALIKKAVEEAHPGFQSEIRPGDDLLAPVQQLADHLGKPLFLFASNVDGMTTALARRFLQSTRILVDGRKVTAVLSGEHDFRDLVHGPLSELAVSNQFMLQGYDLDIFTEQVEKLTHAMCLRFDNPVEAARNFFDLTGGNTYLLRPVLWNILEGRVSAGTAPESVIPVSSLPDAQEIIDRMAASNIHTLHHVIQLIGRHWDNWEHLERLINGEPLPIDPTDVNENVPGPLELAGVFVRDKVEYYFASPLMKCFIAKYYDDRRLGDLYAWTGQWDKAMGHFRRLTPYQAKRPQGTEDRADVALSVSALCSSFYSEASKGIPAVRHLFTQGCRYLLGMRDITFWERVGSTWKLQENVSSASEEDMSRRLREMESLLAATNRSAQGIITLSEAYKRHAVAAILPSLENTQASCVFVADFDLGTVLTGEREKLVRELVKHFVAAYSHAVNVKRAQNRLYMQTQHIHIINSIFEALGSKVRDTGETLRLAGQGLRGMNYRRVLFCLVDPEGKRIKAVYHSSNDDLSDMLEITDYALSSPNEDIQPYVIFTKEPKLISDASREPLVNQEVVRRTQLRTAAVVPIINRAKDAIGTIHVEREDGRIPNADEVDALLTFGQQLAVAIEQSERVNLLQSALDKIPEPVVIVDRQLRVRYSNAEGETRLGIPSGWHYASQVVALMQEKASPQDTMGHILKGLKAALQNNQPSTEHFKGLRNDGEYRGESVIHGIQNWRDETVGALLHINDLKWFHTINQATDVVLNANDQASAAEAILKAAEILGHRWGRLYLLDRSAPNLLVSRLCFGMEEEAAQKFNAHEIILDRNTPSNSETWQCFLVGHPLVFCWHPKKKDKATIVTKLGLRAINVLNPICPDEVGKQPGDFWIDLPLMAAGVPIGKLTVQCNESTRPEQYELLKVFAARTGEILGAFVRHEQGWQEGVAHSFAEAEHAFIRRLNSLQGVLSQYMLLKVEAESPLERANELFTVRLRELENLSERAVRLLSKIEMKPDGFDLKECILRQKVDLPSWTYTGPDKVNIRGDQAYIAEMFLELGTNALKYAATDRELCIEILVETTTRNEMPWVRIRHRDTGRGIKDTDKKRIFDPYVRSESEQGKKGFGLGLSYVRHVCEAHHGKVWEEGKLGAGAEFVIELPIDYAQWK